MTRNIDAYNLYLKGRHFLNQRTRTAILRSIECFEQAACEDCDYVLPYAGLAEAYIFLGSVGYAKRIPGRPWTKRNRLHCKLFEVTKTPQRPIWR